MKPLWNWTMTPLKSDCQTNAQTNQKKNKYDEKNYPAVSLALTFVSSQLQLNVHFLKSER